MSKSTFTITVHSRESARMQGIAVFPGDEYFAVVANVAAGISSTVVFASLDAVREFCAVLSPDAVFSVDAGVPELEDRVSMLAVFNDHQRGGKPVLH